MSGTTFVLDDEPTTVAASPGSVSTSKDPDAPSSSISRAGTTAAASGSTNKPANMSNSNEEDEDEEDDDAAPDYRLLNKFLGNSNAAASGSAAARARPAFDTASIKSASVLPKRGEKDFEPTGFRGQRNALEDSRNAMFSAVGAERRPNKSLSVATWDPILQRAILHSSRGILFQTMGLTNRLPQHHLPPAKIDANGVHWPRLVSRTELTPEETLFLIERGVLECRLRVRTQGADQKEQRNGEYQLQDGAQGEEDPVLDLQRAYALLLGVDGCSKEVYGVYSYLRRLGYVVHRAKDMDLVRLRAAEKAKADREAMAAADAQDDDDEEGAARAEAIISDPKRPLRLVTLWDIVLYIPRRLLQLGGDAMRWLSTRARAAWAWLVGVVSRVLGRGGQPGAAGGSLLQRSISTGLGRPRPSAGLLGIGGRTFADYDSAFSELQIVPSGHDLTTVPRPIPSTSSLTTSPDPFEIFFYAWRPATQFRKTYPPPPEFRIAICNARSAQYVPSLAQFAQLFDSVPLPGTEALDEEDAARAAEQVKRNNASYGKKAHSSKTRAAAAVAAAGVATGQKAGSIFERLVRILGYVFELLGASHMARLFSHLPPGCAAVDKRSTPYRSKAGGGGGHGPRSGKNPFPALKAGRRNVVLAVVDQGTTSLLRFGEAEFGKWKLAGGDKIT
ncbi:tRNA-splicing endonuclease subunit sen54 [Tilletia horrida]|nr:tRNA-splicing endonuclease subunit sen54 [Tilletia horrida]